MFAADIPTLSDSFAVNHPKEKSMKYTKSCLSFPRVLLLLTQIQTKVNLGERILSSLFSKWATNFKLRKQQSKNDSEESNSNAPRASNNVLEVFL